MKKLGGVVALVLGAMFAYGTIMPVLQALSRGSFDPVHAIVWLITGAVAFWLLKIAYRDLSA